MKYLIIIDMQNDFVTGALGSEEAKAIIPKVVEKIKKYPKENIIFTRDTHNSQDYFSSLEGKKLPILHCVKNTFGWQIADQLYPYVTKVIDKNTFGTFKWLNSLNDVTEFEIIGVCTDICVITNALILRTRYPDIEITVDASCCAGSTKEKHNAALTVMESCHINIINKGE